MKRIIVLFVVGLSFLVITNKGLKAQDAKDIYLREHIANKKPPPYTYLREADMIWSKIIWRTIDLREKMNHSFYYPVEMVGDRMSLVRLLWKGVEEGLTAYSDDDFIQPTTDDQIKINWGAVEITEKIPLPDGTEKDTTYVRSIDFSSVQQIEIKERWYFDKQHSVMKARILGICPVRIAAEEVEGTMQFRKTRLFWVYYPEFRNLLASSEVHNRNNDSQRISFDDLFTQRRFNSYIYKESNVYDRTIIEYSTSINALYEAEKIKNWLFEVEHDLWEY